MLRGDAGLTGRFGVTQTWTHGAAVLQVPRSSFGAVPRYQRRACHRPIWAVARCPLPVTRAHPLGAPMVDSAKWYLP